VEKLIEFSAKKRDVTIMSHPERRHKPQHSIAFRIARLAATLADTPSRYASV